MTFEEINKTLKQLFPDEMITAATDSWQIESPDFRMLILLSTDQSWLRSLSNSQYGNLAAIGRNI
ncbi:MAG TPA: hypothetical protein IGS53_20895 [Leptolyngbyaceae cyanobacterium M33_DOE_097]|uniref:Uncharacterized protein n=1 Tax=Oscillatoriales cyanobacterium SpSt-418 TaxID=2282169 RepID=A0A7C3KBR9_9CYAN|nr:hypothetical protein [Leptolyngbyaceae cyanobacterium M33_DOE_097]